MGVACSSPGQDVPVASCLQQPSSPGTKLFPVAWTSQSIKNELHEDCRIFPSSCHHLPFFSTPFESSSKRRLQRCGWSLRLCDCSGLLGFKVWSRIFCWSKGTPARRRGGSPSLKISIVQDDSTYCSLFLSMKVSFRQ